MKSNGPVRVRIPLQVGSGAVQALALGAAVVVPSAAFFAFFPLLMQPVVHGGSGGAFSVTVVGAAWVAATCMWLGARQLARVRARRPSDLIISATGLTFEGGVQDGFALDWRDVEPDRWEVRDDRGRKCLCAGGGEENDATGGGLVLAETTNGDEAMAFLATIAAVTAMCARANGKAPVVAPDRQRMLLLFCTSCGGEVVPVDEAATACPHCSAHVHVPDEIRARLAAAIKRRAQDATANRAVQTVLDQRSAHAASRAIDMGAVVIVVTFAVAVTALYMRMSALRAGDITAAIGLCVAVILGVGCVMIAVTSDRSALHVVTLGLGAVAPAHEGGSWTCRRCGGPMASENVGIALCGYCGAHNVVGFDLTPNLDDAVAGALATRRGQRVTSALLASAGVAVLVGSAIMAIHGD